MTLKQAMKKRATAEQQLRAAAHNMDQAIRDERDAGRTIPELMKATGLSYRGVYLALNRTDERNGK
jgi:DNA-binding protein H-NS